MTAPITEPDAHGCYTNPVAIISAESLDEQLVVVDILGLTQEIKPPIKDLKELDYNNKGKTKLFFFTLSYHVRP